MKAEFELIEQLFKPNVSSALLGIGDDCAVLPVGEGLQTICTDTMVKGVHYPEEAVDYQAIGFKLVAVNVSDTLAMGATPQWATLALSAGSGFEFHSFAKGLSTALKHYNIELVGGDTTQGHETLTLTLLGETSNPVKRSGAQVGDDLVVTGALGFASAGLALLQADQPLPEIYRKAYWEPEPNLLWSDVVQQYASACIDISDGLVQDMGHILKASGGVGAELSPEAFIEKETLDPLAQSLGLNAWDWILAGGDDYQLCLSLPSARRKDFEKMVQSKGLCARVLGSVVESPGIWLGGSLIEAQGYQHQF